MCIICSRVVSQRPKARLPAINYLCLFVFNNSCILNSTGDWKHKKVENVEFGEGSGGSESFNMHTRLDSHSLSGSLFQDKWLQLSLGHLDAFVTFIFRGGLQSTTCERRGHWGKSSFRRKPLELSSRKQRICGIDQGCRALVWAEHGFSSTCGPAVSYHLNQGDSQNFRKA